jgi:anti-anti-sigma factor
VGGQHGSTSEKSINPEISMSQSGTVPTTAPEGGQEMPPASVCSWTKAGRNAAWIRVAGELDLATRPEFERALHEALKEARLVVIDLRELAFMDCSGVHAIRDGNLLAGRTGRRLILVRGLRQVDRVFALTGISSQLEIHDLGSSKEPDTP